MLTAIGMPLLRRLDDELTRAHRYVRAWRAVLEGRCWTDLEDVACPPGCEVPA